MDSASPIKMPQRKPRRKGIKVRCRKLKSVSNRSQISLTQGSSIASYKRRNIALSRNNRDLAAALEDARYDLSAKEQKLKNLKESLNNIQLGRFKILELQSGLKTFVKSFDEALKLLNIDNTIWQASVPPVQSRRSFKNRMKNAIEPVAEASEPDSTILEESVSEFVNKTNQKTLTLNVLDRLHEDSASLETHIEQPKHAELIPDESMSDLVPDKKGIQTTLEEDKQEKSMMIYDTFAGDGAMSKENEDSGTPKLSLTCQISKSCSSLKKSCSNSVLPQVLTNLSMGDENIPDACITSSKKVTTPSKKVTTPSKKVSTPSKKVSTPSKKVTSSKIPKIQDVVQKSKSSDHAVHISSSCNKKTFEGKDLHKYVENELEKNSSRRKTVVLKHPKVLVSASVPSSEFSVEKNTDKNTIYNFSEAGELSCRRKTFVVKAAENSVEFHNIHVSESQESVQKELHIKKNMNDTNKRGTFVVFNEKDASQNDPIVLNKNYATCDSVTENTLQNKAAHKFNLFENKLNSVRANDSLQENASKIDQSSKNKLPKIKKSETNKITKYSTVLLNKGNVPISKITPEANDKVTKPNSFKLDNELLDMTNESGNRYLQVLENTSEIISKVMKLNESELNMIAKNINVINNEEHVISPSKSIPEFNNLKYSEASIISHNTNAGIEFKDSNENIQDLGNSEMHKYIEKPEQNMAIKNCEILLDKINISDMCVPVDSISLTNKKVGKPEVSKQKKSIENCDNLRKDIESNDEHMLILESPNKLSSGKTAHNSFKHSLSSDSENESISHINLDDILKEISPVKPFPVRKVLSKVKPGKKFTFCSNKRKSILNKRLSKSIGNNLLDGNETRLQSKDSSYDNNHVKDAKNLPDTSKHQRKSVSFLLSGENINTTNNVQDRSPKVSHISEKLPKMPVIREDRCEILREMAGFDNIIEKDSHTPDGLNSNCKENTLPCSIDQYSDQNRSGTSHVENVDYSSTGPVTQNKSDKMDPAKKSRKRKDNAAVGDTGGITQIKSDKMDPAKKSRKRKDNAAVDDIALQKKSKKSSKKKGKENKLEKQLIISDADNTSFNNNNNETEKGTGKSVYKVKDKVEKDSKTSFVVEAEIHAAPSPSSFQTKASPNDDKDTSRRLSVVLSDVFNDTDKDAILNYCRTSISLTTHLSENSCNIKSTMDNTSPKKTQSPVKKSEESKGPKVRRRAQRAVSYTEPKLNKKMRR